MLNREIGSLQGSGKYVDYEVGWRLDGMLPFAYMDYHDDMVRGVRWEGGDLAFSIYSQGDEDAEEERVVFVDAQVVREEGWFDAPRIWWEYSELSIVEGGYEVGVTGMIVPDGIENQLPHRHASITVRARDIRVVIGGTAVPPHPGLLPAYMLVAALHENAPAERQAEARRRILAHPNFRYDWLMHPLGRKGSWEGCAAVLSELSDETLQPFLPDLLEWLIDLDWPGAKRVLARLRRMRPELLGPALSAAVRRARAEDRGWLKGLARLHW